MEKQLFVLVALALLLSITVISHAGEPFMVKDINPSGGANPVWLTNVNGVLFFGAYDGVNGDELWKSNGTEAGTVMVKNINPNLTDSGPAELTNVNGVLFFTICNSADYADELWKSDGTEAGTVMVADIFPAPALYPAYLTDVNGILFFDAYGIGDSNEGPGLWKTDGTEAGTAMVSSVRWLMISAMANVNGTLFFEAAVNGSGYGLWKSDGTDAGTIKIKDFASPGPTELTNVNGTLFFAANDGTNGTELWKSDGTEAGTVMVKDICTGSGGSSPSELTEANSIVFFSAYNDANGYELWKSDGTEAGTVVVKDINPGSGNSNPSDLANVNGTLFFQATDGTNGNELWKSDGTEAGTVMVKNINPGAANSNPMDLVNVNGTLFFSANDGSHGYELWQSDGTAAGTFMIKDIYAGSGSSWPEYLTNVNGTLFFTTSDHELWMYVPNDECQDAVQVFSGRTYDGSINGATGTDLTSCAYNDTVDVWYYFQPQTNGKYTISASSNEFDTTLAVFNACGGNELACNDDFQGTDSQIVLSMAKGKRYYIRVSGFEGQTGSFQLSVMSGYCTEYLAGDLNGDCRVDMQDFAIMASQWLACNMSPPELCQQ